MHVCLLLYFDLFGWFFFLDRYAWIEMILLRNNMVMDLWSRRLKRFTPRWTLGHHSLAQLNILSCSVNRQCVLALWSGPISDYVTWCVTILLFNFINAEASQALSSWTRGASCMSLFNRMLYGRSAYSKSFAEYWAFYVERCLCSWSFRWLFYGYLRNQILVGSFTYCNRRHFVCHH